MPKHTSREFAGQFTYAYAKWDGTDATLKNSDAKSLEYLYSTLGYHIDESKGPKSQELLDLYNKVEDFRYKTKECAEKINEGNYTSQDLDHDQDELGLMAAGVFQGMQKLKGDEAKLVSKYLKEWNEMKTDGAQKVMHASGKVQSAADWIDVYKAKWLKGEIDTKEYVGFTLAARQMSNAVYGKRANIDKHKFSDIEIKNHAAKLISSSEFREYSKTLSNIPKETIKHGHGGDLERTFEDFLKKNPPEKPLDFDLHGRYEKFLLPKRQAAADWVDVTYDMAGVDVPAPKLVSDPANYKSYDDYIKKNAGKVTGAKLASAAKMAAAGTLAVTKPEQPFDKKAFDKQTQAYIKDPAFRLAVADPESMELLNKGDVVGFNKNFEVVKAAAYNMLDAKDEFRIDGYPADSLERLEERAEENPDLKPVTESVRALFDGKQTEEKVMTALGNIVKYQDAHASDNATHMGKDLNDTVRLMHELTKGSPYLNTLVDKQIDKINESRGATPNGPNYLTKEFIAKEGIENEKKAEQELGIGKQNEEVVEEGHDVHNEGFIAEAPKHIIK